MKTFFIVLVVLVLIGGGYYFLTKPTTPPAQYSTAVSDETTASPTTDGMTMPATPQAPATTAPVSDTASQRAIVIKDMAFSPNSVTVKAGTTVTWTNQDSVPHTVTPDADSTITPPTLATGESYKFTFNTPGTFKYHCAIHPTMHGTIIVTK